MKKPTHKIYSKQEIELICIICLLFFVLMFVSCKPSQRCAANDKRYFYRENHVKPFKKVNQLRCFKF